MNTDKTNRTDVLILILDVLMWILPLGRAVLGCFFLFQGLAGTLGAALGVII